MNSALPSRFQPQVLLFWASATTPPFLRLCGNVLREICDYLKEDPMISCISNSCVCSYRLDTLEWEVRFSFSSLDLDISKATLLCLGGDTLFACGQTKSSLLQSLPASAAFILTVNGAEKLPSMSVFRRSPGLFYYFLTQSIFLFGGGCSSQGKY